ncbi:MAG: hypothetical protein JSV85_02795 [Candidatus Bathyarchaeota archaeon]|nr:MAG: hypothetical protein JSV85_02795 [Candidatus Bathyarchaeota archaeon]
MEAAEVLSGIFLIMIGILAAAPFPLDGWFYEELPEFAAIGLVFGVVIAIFGVYLTISGFKSRRKSRRTDTIGAFCLLLSFVTLLTAFIMESGIWAWSFTAAGVGFLIVGVSATLVGERRTTKK